jgi:hypothetical protein
MLNRFRSRQAPSVKTNMVEAKALECLEAWLKQANSRQPSATTRLYSDDAVFIPTLHAGLITDRTSRTDYFAKLFGRSGFSVRLDRVQTQMLGSDAVICSGFYTFGYFDQGQFESIKARFTMVFREVNGQVLIVNHHSSRRP